MQTCGRQQKHLSLDIWVQKELPFKFILLLNQFGIFQKFTDPKLLRRGLVVQALELLQDEGEVFAVPKLVVGAAVADAVGTSSVIEPSPKSMNT